MKKNTISTLIVIIVAINAIGILLKYLGLDTYFILTGFRFQLSLFLPIIFLFRKCSKDFLINIFRSPSYKGNLFFIYVLIIPLLLFIAILFLLKKIVLGDPDYFYEFGISSIIDFPVYLIWNSIQLIFFYLFLIYVVSKVKLKFITVLLMVILLFAYEVIPFKMEKLEYFHLVSLFFFAVIAGLFVKYYQNIYWIVVFTFSILWLNFLLFGSNSRMIINLLFASQYNSWEGFFSVGDSFKVFILPVHLLFVNIFILINLLMVKSKNIIDLDS